MTIPSAKAGRRKRRSIPAVLLAMALGITPFSSAATQDRPPRFDVWGRLDPDSRIDPDRRVVVALDPTDSTVVEVAVTFDGGVFRIPALEPGLYLLQTKAVGYRVLWQPFVVEDCTIDLGAITLYAYDPDAGPGLTSDPVSRALLELRAPPDTIRAPSCRSTGVDRPNFLRGS